MQQELRDQRHKNFLKGKKQNDRKAREFIFQAGQEVLLETKNIQTGLSKRFQPKYEGPHKIVWITSSKNAALIAYNGDHETVEMVSCERLKPYKEPLHGTKEKVEPVQDNDRDDSKGERVTPSHTLA